MRPTDPALPEASPRPRHGMAGLAGIALLLSLARLAPAASPLALSCLGCHQPRINAASMPSLEHRTVRDIAAALRTARESPVSGSIMARFAAGLSDADIEALASELGRPD